VYDQLVGPGGRKFSRRRYICWSAKAGKEEISIRVYRRELEILAVNREALWPLSLEFTKVVAIIASFGTYGHFVLIISARILLALDAHDGNTHE